MSEARTIAKIEPNDHGPIYRETDMSRLPVEPWSTFSNLIFLAVFIFFTLKTRFNYKKFPLMVIFLSILFVGWFGGTVYHATRSNNIWLLLDYLPIMFLVLMASIYFWRELVGNWLLVLAFTLMPIVTYRFIYEFIALPHYISISLGYTLLALVVVVPLVPHCIHKTPEGWKFLVGALAAFAFAISFRLLDNQEIISFMPMGTHFLWHFFGGICCFCMFYYVFNAEKTKRNKKATDSVQS